MVNKRVGEMRRNIGSGSKFDYRPAKPEHVKRQMERRGGRQFDGIFKDKHLGAPLLVLSKLNEGDNTLRILPASWEGHDDFAHIVWVHKYVAERGSYVCPQKLNNDPCPLCDEAARARKDKDDDRAREYSPSESMICWVIDRKSREFEDEPQLYAMPPTLYKDINGVIYDPQTGEATMFDHPQRGRDVRVKRTGTQLNTRYLPILAGRDTPISEDRDITKRILAYIKKHPVPDLLDVKSETYLEKILSGGARDDDEDEYDDDEPESRRSSKRKAKSRGDEDDDEEEEDHEADREAEDEAEEEEARQHMRNKRAKAKDEEEDRPRRKLRAREDDEDEDDEPDEDEDAEADEEEDERPRRKSRIKAKAKSRDDDNGEDEDEPDDDEDADDEPDDDDEPPRRKSKAKKSREEDDEEDLRPRRARARERA